MTTAKATFYRSLGLTGALPDMERKFYEGGFAKVPYILAQSAVPVCLAPNGTVATNGTITLGTALPTTYSGGIWLRLPANAVVGGAAGLYWAVMSSTTVGQVYTNFEDPASEFIPYIPSGALVAATGSNAAYTQATATDVTLVNVLSLTGGTLGATGGIRITKHTSVTTPANANSKQSKIKLASTDIANDVVTSNVTNTGCVTLFNRGSESSQVGTRTNQPFGSAASGSLVYSTVDTSADAAISFANNIATATDYMILEAFIIEVLPS